MIGTIRQILRARRNARRIARDDARDALLGTDSGKTKYRNNLAAERQESSLIALLEEALKQSGDVVECGVFRGDSLQRILATVHDIAPERIVFGLDSFEGFPPGGITDLDITRFRPKTRLEGKFTNANDVPDRMTRFAETFGMNLELRRGYFEHTLPSITDRTFCFIHIDCDTYSGHIEVLDALYERLAVGEIIVFDDYNTEEWPGATQAVDEFFAGRPETIQHSTTRARPAWFTVKSK